MHQQLFFINETSLHLNYTIYQITHPNTALQVMPFKNKKYNHLFTIYESVFYYIHGFLSMVFTAKTIL